MVIFARHSACSLDLFYPLFSVSNLLYLSRKWMLAFPASYEGVGAFIETLNVLTHNIFQNVNNFTVNIFFPDKF